MGLTFRAIETADRYVLQVYRDKELIASHPWGKQNDLGSVKAEMTAKRAEWEASEGPYKDVELDLDEWTKCEPKYIDDKAIKEP